MKQISEYEINCIAMAIVNHTNEVNGADAKTRQKNNDKCFDFAEKKIKEAYVCGIDYAKGKDITVTIDFNSEQVQKYVIEKIKEDINNSTRDSTSVV